MDAYTAYLSLGVDTRSLISLQSGRMMTARAGLAVRMLCNTHVHLGCCELCLYYIVCCVHFPYTGCLLG